MASELGVQTIQHTNGTDALTVGSDGSVTTQGAFYPNGLTYWPSFLVSGNNSSQWKSYAAGEVLQFNDSSTGTLFDTGSNFNTSTYQFVAPVNGIYCFGLQIYTLQTVSEGRVCIAKNGFYIAGVDHLMSQAREDANQDVTNFYQVTLPLAAGDFVDGRSHNATSHYIQHSFFTGHLVAPT